MATNKAETETGQIAMFRARGLCDLCVFYASQRLLWFRRSLRVRERKKRRKKMGLKLWLAQVKPRPQYDCWVDTLSHDTHFVQCLYIYSTTGRPKYMFCPWHPKADQSSSQNQSPLLWERKYTDSTTQCFSLVFRGQPFSFMQMFLALKTQIK